MNNIVKDTLDMMQAALTLAVADPEAAVMAESALYNNLEHYREPTSIVLQQLNIPSDNFSMDYYRISQVLDVLWCFCIGLTWKAGYWQGSEYIGGEWVKEG